MGFVLAMIAIDLVVARTAVAPRTPYDEVGVLQAARYLSGAADIPQTLSLGYYPGAAIFIVPLWWFTDDAATVYSWAAHINIVIGWLTVIPLALLARRLGLTTAQAVAAAAVVMLLPARTAISDYVLSEQAIVFFLAWASYAAFVVWARPTAWRMSLLVLAVLACYLTHTRALVLVLVTGIWLVLFLRRRVSTAIFGLSLLVVGAYVVNTAAGYVVDQLVVDGFRQGEGLQDKLLSLGGVFARVSFTQTWAQLFATLGLVAIGGLLLTVRTWQDLVRDKVVGPNGFLWGTVVGSALLSFVSVSSFSSHFYNETDPRFDTWTYTRYIDSFVIAVVLVALVAIIRGLDTKIAVAAFAGSVAVVGGTLVWAITIVPTFGSNLGPANNAGIYALLRFRDLEPFDLPLFPTFTNDNRLWAFGSLFIVLALVVVLLLRRYPFTLFLVMGVAMVVTSWYGNPSQKREAPYELEQAVESIERVGGDSADITFLLDCPVKTRRNVAANWIGFWFSDRQVTLLDGVEDLTDESTVIACNGWQNPDDAPRVGDLATYSYSVYVLDPELVEQLRAEDVTLEPQP